MKRALMILAIVLVMGCAGKQPPVPPDPTDANRPTPPQLTVTAGAITIPVKMGSYCWSKPVAGDQMQSLCVDTVGPQDLLKGTEPAQVKPGAVLELRFAEPPAEANLNLWVGGQARDIALEPGNRITAPTEPGTYIYTASGRWPGRGDGSYAFHIHVQ